MDLIKIHAESVSVLSLADISSKATSITDLPNEILDYIFSFLDFVERLRIEEVCKQWRVIGSSPTQLKIDANHIQNFRVNDNILCAILSRRGSMLKELVLKSNTDLTTESLTGIGKYCPNLSVLELHLLGNPQIGCLKVIAPGCPNLKVVRLYNRTTTSDHIHEIDDGEAYLSRFYKRRQSYSTFNEKYNEGLLAISKHCRLLESLQISHLREIDVRSLEEINPNLHTICLYFTTLTPEGMQCLMKRCRMLKSITMVCCDLWDKRAVLDFLKHYRRTLTVLKMKGQGFDGMDWREGFEVLVNLEVLQLFRCSIVDDDLMEVLSQKCIRLWFLDIGYTHVTDVGLVSLCMLPALKVIRIDRQKRIRGYGLELLVAKGILQEVTIPTDNTDLQEACHKLSKMCPKVRFIMGAEAKPIEHIRCSRECDVEVK